MHGYRASSYTPWEDVEPSSKVNGAGNKPRLGGKSHSRIPSLSRQQEAFETKDLCWKIPWHNSPPLTLPICPGAIVKHYLNHGKDKLFLPVGRSTMWVSSSILQSLTNLSLHCSDSCSKYLDLLHPETLNCVQ